MKGHLDEASATRIRGWFIAKKAFLTANNSIFPVENGHQRLDLVPHGLPVNGGFELTAQSNPDLFSFIASQRDKPILFKLYADQDLRKPLDPVNGLILQAKAFVIVPKISDVSLISGFSVSSLEAMKTFFLAEGYLVLPRLFRNAKRMDIPNIIITCGTIDQQ